MDIIIIAAFLFCAAFAAGSILLALRLMKIHDQPFVRALLYYIIFSFTFGIYSIWGQFVISFIATPDLSPAAISSISIFALLFGLPFFVFSWLMLLRFSSGAAGKNFPAVLTITFLTLNFGLIIALGILAGETSYIKALPYIKYYYAGASLLCSLTSTAIIISRSNSMPPLNTYDRFNLSAILLTGVISQGLALLLIKEQILMALVVAFLLFGFTAAIPVYLNYFAVFRATKPAKPLVASSMVSFMRDFDISPREADIIREICCGLSNQEIADKLFISLQTVKDHTHRIYIKTNVRNRMQLMTRVKRTEE